jgi:UDP-glucose 4-epimerase
MKALITGGAGFIGSHLAEALLERGNEVTVIDNLSTGRFENIQHLVGKPRFRFAIDTITNEVVIDRLTSECNVVFHMAAAVGVKLIVECPVHTIETNVMGTEVVLKTALRYRAKVLIASTSEVYGKGNSIPFREDDDVVLGPTCRSRWAYAASKMVDEFLALAYHKEKGLPVVIARLFNTVGPRQTGHYGMVVPRFFHQALKGELITVYGDGTQTRCFCDVSDVVQALIALVSQSEALGQVYNIGSTEEISIHELAHMIKGITRSDSPIINVSYSEAYSPGFEDMQRRVPDISRILSLIDWSPKRGLHEILKNIFEYERKQTKIWD